MLPKSQEQARERWIKRSQVSQRGPETRGRVGHNVNFLLKIPSVIDSWVHSARWEVSKGEDTFIRSIQSFDT